MNENPAKDFDFWRWINWGEPLLPHDLMPDPPEVLAQCYPEPDEVLDDEPI